MRTDTPMYQDIWTRAYAIMESEMSVPIDSGLYTRISNRVGLLYYDGSDRFYWHHICHPRKLWASTKRFSMKENRFDFTHHLCHFNLLSNGIDCKSCKKQLTKVEQLLIRSIVIQKRI